MPLTNAMRNFYQQNAIGEAVTLFNNANARIGVGDSAAAFAVTQTDLQAATNRFRKAMEPTFPQRTDNVLTFRASFGPAEANFAWNEWGIFNAAVAGVMMNRRVENLGVKAVGTWVVTVTVTLNIS